jgi:hypothetical protein
VRIVGQCITFSEKSTRMNRFSLFFVAFVGMAYTASTASAQITPFIEIQGEAAASPYENQTVTVSGKVTETFGDSWYMQDAYGAWNGLYIVGPDVVIPANAPYWNADRQPEVGDVLELTGTVVEEDGNTQLVDVELVEFVDFWNATPAGVWTSAAESQDEQYEGTRIRLENATVLTAPDADGYWTVAMDDGEVTCWGVDTYDPSGNEDPDGPTPGDVYLIYGASHQAGDEYVLHVGDIDVVSLGVADQANRGWRAYPNPATDVVVLDAHLGAISGPDFCIRIFNSSGQMVMAHLVPSWPVRLNVESLKQGLYFFELTGVPAALSPPKGRFVKS